MKKLLLIVNNLTGKGQNGSSTFRLVRKFTENGYMVTVCPIDAGLDTTPETYIEASEYDMVVCQGGDGTLSHLINVLMDREKNPPVGYIPAGTTNDFSKNIGIPKNIEKASDIVLNGSPSPYHVGHFNDRYFCYVASFGAFADSSYTTAQSIKNLLGHSAYILNSVGSITKALASRHRLKVETGSEVFEDEFIFGAIANSLSVAGFALPSMDKDDIFDEFYELLLIKCPRTDRDYTRIITALINGDFENDLMIFRKIRRADITALTETDWTLDGEYGGHPEKIRFDIRYDAVRIMTAGK